MNLKEIMGGSFTEKQKEKIQTVSDYIKQNDGDKNINDLKENLESFMKRPSILRYELVISAFNQIINVDSPIEISVKESSELPEDASKRITEAIQNHFSREDFITEIREEQQVENPRLTHPDDYPCDDCDFCQICSIVMQSDKIKLMKCRAFLFFKALQEHENISEEMVNSFKHILSSAT